MELRCVPPRPGEEIFSLARWTTSIGRHDGNSIVSKWQTTVPFHSPTSTRSPLDMEVEVDQDLISPANVPSANAPAMPPIVPETTQATTTSTFAPWRTSRRTTGKFSSVWSRSSRTREERWWRFDKETVCTERYRLFYIIEVEERRCSRSWRFENRANCSPH